jgi:hypothetical protein
MRPGKSTVDRPPAPKPGPDPLAKALEQAATREEELRRTIAGSKAPKP